MEMSFHFWVKGDHVFFYSIVSISLPGKYQVFLRKARVRSNILHVLCFHVITIITIAGSRKKKVFECIVVWFAVTPSIIWEIVLNTFSCLTVHTNEVF